MAQARTVSTKIRKKNWYPLIAPRIFNNAFLGETLVYEEGAMLGKTISQNLMNLTGDIKKQNTNMNFIVTKVEGGKGLTKIIGFNMISASIKRLTRRRSEKIELSFTAETSDGKHVRIKPLIFAISNIKSSVGHHLRRAITDFLIKTINKMTFDDLVKNLISHQLQISLRQAIKKIYPVRACQIKSMYIEEEKKHGEEEVKKPEAKVKKAEVKKVEEKAVEVKKEIKKEAKVEIKSEEKSKEEVKEKTEVKQETKTSTEEKK